MAKKQMIHAYIEPHIYVALKTQETNISQTVNELLAAFINNTEIETDEALLIKEIEETKKQIDTLSKQMGIKAAQIAATREAKQKEQEETEKVRGLMYEAAKLNNPARDL